MFLKSILKGVLITISITLLIISNAFADKYPSKPIKLIVPYGAGGGGDTTSRFIADLATDILGVKVLVENKTGGGGTIGIGPSQNLNLMAILLALFQLVLLP